MRGSTESQGSSQGSILGKEVAGPCPGDSLSPQPASEPWEESLEGTRSRHVETLLHPSVIESKPRVPSRLVLSTPTGVVPCEPLSYRGGNCKGTSPSDAASRWHSRNLSQAAWSLPSSESLLRWICGCRSSGESLQSPSCWLTPQRERRGCWVHPCGHPLHP